ncbi:fasciclin domain-containing protein [Chitinophaga solisilvae]|uniref:fasciclin domain-containing protein n=1 Tax=Chitinophaga solisilvae TaxID=1233460 RepID=UPI00137220BA|nr:fasciclin domain-containing protein [Chitinophaga solisilvae]
MQLHKLSFLFFLSLLIVTGCKKDNLTLPPDEIGGKRAVGDFVRNNYDLSILAAGLEKTGLMDSLNQPGPFTLFAPDNNAFKDMGVTSAAAFNTMNTDSLRDALKYHVFRERKYIGDFPVQMSNKFVTLSGAEMYVSVSMMPGSPFSPPIHRNVYVNGALVYKENKRDIALANGVVHVIRKPLKYYPQNIQEFLQADTSLTLFVAALKQFKLWDGLSAKGPFTVFAPDNKAFRNQRLTADSISRMDPAAFKPIAMSIYTTEHKIRRIFSTDWQQINGNFGTNDTFIQLTGFIMQPFYEYNSYNLTETAYLKPMTPEGGAGTNGPYIINYKGSIAKGTDHVVTNGVVHKIDDLLLYPRTLRK